MIGSGVGYNQAGVAPDDLTGSGRAAEVTG
jgi:hypothetical protein